MSEHWSEAEYDLALKRIDEIFDAEPNTAEGKELDMLADAIMAYEEKHYPLGEVDPQFAAEFRCEQQGYHWPVKRITLEPENMYCTKCGKVLGRALLS